MIRTHILPCNLPRPVTDALNLATCVLHARSGSIYTQVLVSHWRKRFCTTIWKNTAIKKDGAVLTLSNGKGNRAITITLPAHLTAVLGVLEVRLVFDKKTRRYPWHVVVENGTQPKTAPGSNVVSVDLGEVRPAVVGQINILSAYATGKPGKLPTPAVVKQRMPHNLRLRRRRRDTGQVLSTCTLAYARAWLSPQEAAPLQGQRSVTSPWTSWPETGGSFSSALAIASPPMIC